MKAAAAKYAPFKPPRRDLLAPENGEVSKYRPLRRADVGRYVFGLADYPTPANTLLSPSRYSPARSPRGLAYGGSGGPAAGDPFFAYAEATYRQRFGLAGVGIADRRADISQVDPAAAVDGVALSGLVYGGRVLTATVYESTYIGAGGNVGFAPNVAVGDNPLQPDEPPFVGEPFTFTTFDGDDNPHSNLLPGVSSQRRGSYWLLTATSQRDQGQAATADAIADRLTGARVILYVRDDDPGRDGFSVDEAFAAGYAGATHVILRRYTAPAGPALWDAVLAEADDFLT